MGLPCAKHYSKGFTCINSLNPHKSHWSRYHYYSQFMDEESEVQRGTSLLEENLFLQALQVIPANNNINNSEDICHLLCALHTVFILCLHNNTEESISISLS